MAKYDVFISYSRKDSEIVDEICAELKRLNLTIFVDREIVPDHRRFAETITDNIINSSIYLCIVGNNWNCSKFTHSELTYAINHKDSNHILVYVIDEGLLQMDLRLMLCDLNCINKKQFSPKDMALYVNTMLAKSNRFFISYSSLDEYPRYITSELERHGYQCWIAPRNIKPGMPYARAIMEGIENSDTLLVFISSNSVKSEDVLNEIDNAHRLKKQIIPVFTEPIELTSDFAYYLNRRQWVYSYKTTLDDTVQSIISSIPPINKSLNRMTIAKMVELRNVLNTLKNGGPIFADIIIRVESTSKSNKEIEFVNKVPHNNLPAVYIQAVKNSVNEYISCRNLFGIKVTLIDGSFHPINSSEMAFTLVAENAIKKAIEQVGLTTL